MNAPVLTPIDELIPASYNPRITDPERLARLAVSIRKLGWLLPVYATKSGELLSGHQRSLVARQLGYTHVPCVRCDDMEDVKRKAVNIMFNRSTNDMEAVSDTKDLKRQLLMNDLAAKSEAMPDRHEHYPCMTAEELEIEPFLKANLSRFVPYAATVARRLHSDFRIRMPIVVDEDGNVVNGIGRLELAAYLGERTAAFVRISNQEAELARICLNLISMDFALGDKYADFLRANSFRRKSAENSASSARRDRGYNRLGWAFLMHFGHDVNGTDFDAYQPSLAKAWKSKYGATVVDFGGGRGRDTEVLRDIGCRVSFFEPFYTFDDRDEVDVEGSRRIADEFLKDVASGMQYSSLFLSHVLNSVPFRDDRVKILTILAALAGRMSTLYAMTHSDRNSAYTGIVTGSEALVNSQKFILDYEPHTTIGELTLKPKVQKYHTKEEVEQLFGEHFEQVTIGVFHGSEWGIFARKPKPIDPAKLRAALEFEFNVPYANGERMNRHEQAIAAFEKRLKIRLQ